MTNSQRGQAAATAPACPSYGTAELARFNAGWQAGLKTPRAGWASRRQFVRAAMRNLRIPRAEAEAMFERMIAQGGAR